MGIHLRVISKSSPTIATMTGLRWFSKILCFLVFWKKEASVLEGFSIKGLVYFMIFMNIHLFLMFDSL